MSAGSNGTIIFEVADRLRRSWWTTVTGLCLGLAAATVALHYAPKTYRASTLIFVAPQQIPQEFVRSTVTDDMAIRLQSLKESVLSKPNLVKLVEGYVGAPNDAFELERVVADTRARIEVDLIGITNNGGKSGGTFRLSYRDKDSKRAADLVNALAQLYMEQNVTSRTAQAEGTTKTIQGLADDVSAKIEAQQRSIAEFKRRHPYETADQQEANLQQLQGRQQDLNTNAVARAAAQDRLATLRAQQSVLSAATGVPSELPVGADSSAQRLITLERELQVLQSKYTETHPEVIAKTREIEDVRAALASADPSGPAPSVGQPPLTPLQAGIQSAEREIQRRDADEAQINRDIAEFKRRLEATPLVQAQLLELSKGYDVLLEQYKRRLGNAEEARGAQKIEETQKGERFEVIERATPPLIPISPIPSMIFGVGALAGLFVFVGPLLAKALLDPVICSEAGLIDAADVPVLITIPRVVTREIEASIRGRLAFNVSMSLASVVALAVTAVLYR